MKDMLQGYVESGVVPGLVALVARGDDVQVEAVGSAAGSATGSAAGSTALGAAGPPIRRDSIFRISSLTKPVAAVAAMTLVDEGRLRLDDPVDRLLPELADRVVLRSPDGPLDDTVPAERPITPRDLLTLLMGLGHPLTPPDAIPIQREESRLELRTFGPPVPRTPHTPDEWMRRLGTLPLMAQPGERWLYDTGLHVLGVLIARAAGAPLDVALRERIFEPLGMVDTGFTVPAASLDRLVESYADGSVLDPAGAGSLWATPPPFPGAAGGLASTVDDYLAFARMLLAHGAGIVSEESVAEMTRDQLTEAQAEDAVPLLEPGYGWGLGLAVAKAGDVRPRGYGWDGGLGSSWANDPESGTIGILMAQRFSSEETYALRTAFWAEIP